MRAKGYCIPVSLLLQRRGQVPGLKTRLEVDVEPGHPSRPSLAVHNVVGIPIRGFEAANMAQTSSATFFGSQEPAWFRVL